MLIDNYNMKPIIHIGGAISRLNTPYTMNELRHIDPSFKTASDFASLKTGGSVKSFFKKIGKAIKNKVLPKVKNVFDKVRKGAERVLSLPVIKQGIKTIVGAVGSVAGIPPTITSNVVDTVVSNLGSFNKMVDDIENEIEKSGIMSSSDAKTFAKSVVSTIKNVSDKHPEVKEALTDRGKKILESIKNRVYTKDDKEDLVASAPFLPLVSDDSVSSEPKKVGEGVKYKVKKIPVSMLRAAGLDGRKYPATPIKRIVTKANGFYLGGKGTDNGKGFYLGGSGCYAQSTGGSDDKKGGKLPPKTNKEALDALRKKWKL